MLLWLPVPTTDMDSWLSCPGLPCWLVAVMGATNTKEEKAVPAGPHVRPEQSDSNSRSRATMCWQDGRRESRGLVLLDVAGFFGFSFWFWLFCPASSNGRAQIADVKLHDDRVVVVVAVVAEICV